MSGNGVPTAAFYRDQSQNQQRQSTRWKNQPQLNGLSAGAFILVTGGMGFAQSVGWDLNMFTTLHFHICWFIGAIVGAIIAAPLMTILTKKIYFFIGSILVIVGALIFISVPYDYNAIVAARYLNGIGTGFVTVSFLVLAGESSAHTFRGSCLSMEQYSIALGIAIQIIYASQWTVRIDFPANRLHGIISLILGFCALVTTFFSTTESPIYYLLKCDEASAVEWLRCLERPQIVTDETRAQLDELKLYVLESENQGLVGSFLNGLLPLLKMVLYRGLVALTFSLPINMVIAVACSIELASSWPLIIYGLVRMIGSFVGFWFMDGSSRKVISLLPLLCIAGMAIGIGIIFSDSKNILSHQKMTIICAVTIIYQFFAGIYATTSSVYLGEAFPLLVKPYMIACTLTVEYLVHIIILSSFVLTAHNLYVFSITLGALSLALMLLYWAVLPNTMGTRRQEAEERFQRFIIFEFY